MRYSGRVLCSIEEVEDLEVYKVLFNWVDSNENRSEYFSQGIFVTDDIMRCTGENTNNHINIIFDYYRMGATMNMKKWLRKLLYCSML